MADVWLSDDEVIITKSEYDQLVTDSEFLQNLRNAGVDNWDGYHYGWTGENDD